MKTWKQIMAMIGKFKVILTGEQKKLAVLVFILTLFGALIETLGVSAILPLVQAILDVSEVLKNPIIAQACNLMHISETKDVLLLIAIGVILIYVAKNVYLSFLSWVRIKYSTKVQRELSIQMICSYVERGYSFFRTRNSGELLRGVTQSTTAVYSILLQMMKMVAELLTIICVSVYIFVSDWLMALGMVIIITVCLVTVFVLSRGLMKKAGRVFYKNTALSNKWVLQLFSGIKEVLVMNKKDYFVDRFKEAHIAQQKGRISQTLASEIPLYIIEATCVIGMVVMVCIRVFNMDEPSQYVPQLAAFAVAAFRLLPSVGRISASLNIFVFNVPFIEDVYINIVESEKMKESQLPERKEECVLSDFQNQLQIENVSWRYPDGEENVLSNISLEIKKGDSVAFVGPSGAGKSTLADIVLGLFKPQEGGILVDGVDITGNREQVSKLISFVPQFVYLLDDSVRRNIAFGVYDKDIDDERVWAVLEQAQMKDFIEELPDGLDTVIGERGVRFSGGQSQRLAIARALYTNPQILILDEATSALDNETENAVMEAIDSLQGKVTMIIIAHRLTTVKNCDKIYEISGGKARERKYSELVV